jgi:hypothetical protein
MGCGVGVEGSITACRNLTRWCGRCRDSCTAWASPLPVKRDMITLSAHWTGSRMHTTRIPNLYPCASLLKTQLRSWRTHMILKPMPYKHASMCPGLRRTVSAQRVYCKIISPLLPDSTQCQSHREHRKLSGTLKNDDHNAFIQHIHLAV